MNQHVRLTRLRKLSKSLHDQFHKIHHKLIEISHSGEALVLIICSKTLFADHYVRFEKIILGLIVQWLQNRSFSDNWDRTLGQSDE